MARAALNDDDRRELLRIARTTLREMTRTGDIPPGKPHREALLVPSAVFVALRRDGALRGCAGTFVADQPLYRAVQLMAVAAAARDPRFDPVTTETEGDVVLAIARLPAGAPAFEIGATDGDVCFADEGELARLDADRFDEISHPPLPRRRGTRPRG